MTKKVSKVNSKIEKVTTRKVTEKVISKNDKNVVNKTKNI